MLKFLKYIFITIAILPLLSSCNDDLLNGLTGDDLNGEMPVEFDFQWPMEISTRAFEPGTNVKTKFKLNDVIHVLGKFNVSYLQDDGEYKEETLTRYGALSFNGKAWVKVNGSTLTWPSNATDGQFIAYYISGSDGVLTKDTPTFPTLLSNVTPDSDPLYASSAEGIKYGYGVPLSFHHICSYLTLEDLEPLVSDNYWLTTSEVFEYEDGPARPFHNAFQISLANIDNPSGPDLKFEFTSQEDPNYKQVYIKGHVLSYESIPDEEGNPIVIPSKANFFLEPGFYQSFNLIYPAGTQTTYNYLEYNYENIPENVGGSDVENIPPDLKAGVTYTLVITKSPGITITVPPEIGGWDDTDIYYDVDVEEFLKAVNNEDEYWYESEGVKTQILEKTANGTKLLHNVDFNNFNYSNFIDKAFRPNNMQDSEFDGGLHYIRNLASPLFRFNYGTIKNLGIKNTNISIVSYEDVNQNDDMSRNGALCQWNRQNALISNIRVESVNMNVYIKSDDTGETHNVGGILGVNTGKIQDVEFSGNFNINVSALNSSNPLGDGKDYPVMASVLIGGITGQNAGEGSIYNISPLQGTPPFRIVNNCIGNYGSYSVGGIVGESQGYITGVNITNVTVDGTGSSGVTSYMGGIAGQLAVSTSTGSVSNANTYSNRVSGTIRAGVSKPYGVISSVSYTGGISGTLLNVPVEECNVSVSVYGPATTVENVTYGTGGAFGRIRTAGSYKIESIYAYGSALQYPAGTYVGNFAGIAPVGQTWEGNYADKDIIVRIFPGINYIGLNQDDQ